MDAAELNKCTEFFLSLPRGLKDYEPIIEECERAYAASLSMLELMPGETVAEYIGAEELTKEYMKKVTEIAVHYADAADFAYLHYTGNIEARKAKLKSDGYIAKAGSMRLAPRYVWLKNFTKLRLDTPLQHKSAVLDALEKEEDRMITIGRLLQLDEGVRVMLYARVYFEAYNRKIYTISDSLAWSLMHTELRNLPVASFTLPYPTLYFVMPDSLQFKIREYDKDYIIRGMYVSESKVDDHRTITLTVFATVENSKTPLVNTVTHTLEFLVINGHILEADLEVTCNCSRDVGSEKEWLSTARLLVLFRFLVNVFLYATHPDSDISEVLNTNPDFKALYKKAHDATGKKKERLLKDLNATKTSPRILLGGAVKVSRQERADVEAFYAKRGKQCVRTYVAQHWQHIWSGPMDGERKRTYQLIKSYWRGPEDAPITTKVHHLV